MIGGLFVRPLKEKGGCLSHFMLTYSVAVFFFFAYFDIMYLGGCLIRFCLFLFRLVLHFIAFSCFLFLNCCRLFSLGYDTTYRSVVWYFFYIAVKPRISALIHYPGCLFLLYQLKTVHLRR